MDYVKNSVFLITGGTGSFGQTMVKELLKRGCNEVRVLSRDEKKQEDLRNEIQSNKVKYYIGDVRDSQSIKNAFIDVQYVFHAAALKQVPSCEFYPLESVKTNIIGTENVIEESIAHSVRKMILLSTDKAVYPINSMGMSKALAEKILIARSRELKKNQTILATTRYGNVMGSRGSIIPLIIRQIKKNIPITMTDLNMTRFLMSLDDSIDLVFKAFKEGKQGEIFIMKSPATSLENLAGALIKIFKSSIKIKIIGTRHGEKLHETLVSREELMRAAESKKHFIIKPDSRNLDYTMYFSKGKEKLSKMSDYSSNNTNILDLPETIKLLKKLTFIKEEFSR